MVFHDNTESLLQFINLSAYKRLSHFSTTIKGGVSSGTYASFNLGLYAGDNQECIEQNRLHLTQLLNIEKDALYSPYQTHSNRVVTIDHIFLSKPDFEQDQLLHGVDALITNVPQIAIGITTADCVPILIYDPVRHIVAAIHAGWRGTTAKIAANVIITLIETFGSNPQDMIAAIGPSICQEYFEVGDEVVSAFSDARFPINLIGKKNVDTQKIHLNLQLANKFILKEMGINESSIEITDLCTFSHPDLFFSARRQGFQCGRLMTGALLF